MRERRIDLETRQQNAALDILEGDARTRNFYREVMHLFVEKGLPFLIGGTFALQRYTGIVRQTKDIDFFIKRGDFELFASTCRAAGFRVELTYPHWLGKVFRATDFADLAFRSANGEGGVDDDWFKYAVQEQFWGMSVGLCPPEETIWSKSFVMERERFDGADVVHIIRACGETLDWERLLRRFGENWRVLLMHLISFGYVYPTERDIVPREVMNDLLQRAARETAEGSVKGEQLCRGTMISREQYLTDVYEWGYIDARLEPHGKMSEDDVDHWTAAIDR